MDDVYENIGHYNPNKKRKILIVFDDMIADSVSKDVRLTLTHYLIMKIENKKKILQPTILQILIIKIL